MYVAAGCLGIVRSCGSRYSEIQVLVVQVFVGLCTRAVKVKERLSFSFISNIREHFPVMIVMLIDFSS